MKRNLLIITAILSIGYFNVFGQSEMILYEDFQEWEATDDTDPADCENGLVLEYQLTRTMSLLTSSGEIDINVTLVKAGIAPECDTKHVNRGDVTENSPGVTTGFVSLNKQPEPTDTIGEFIFGPIAQIDSIVFAHSATGNPRGIRVYKSSDGSTWERATNDEFNAGLPFDTQRGNVSKVELGETNVYIRFTSGVDGSDASQFSRLHNITVYGVPGEGPVSVQTNKLTEFKVYAVSGTDMFKLEGKFKKVVVYNTLGAVMKSVFTPYGQTISLNGAPNGIYIVKAIDDTGAEMIKKVIKR